MRKLLLTVGILIAALILIAGALLMFVDVNQYRGVIQGQLEKALGRKVTLGAMSLHIFPLAIGVQDVAIAEDLAFHTQNSVLSAKELSVRVALLPLLGKRIEVESIRAREPAVELVKSREGRWNFSSLGKGGAGKGGGEFILSELILENGRVAVTDLEEGKKRQVYDNINLTLRDLAPGKPVTADAVVKLPQDVVAKASMTATYDMASQRIAISSLALNLGALNLTGSGSADFSATPARIDLQVKSEKAAIGELAKLAGALGAGFTPDMKVDGTMSADVHITGAASSPQFSGSVAAANVVVNGKGWKQPVRTQQMKVQFTPDAIRTGTFVIESGGTHLGAVARISNYTTAPRLNASLSTKGANLGELLNVASAYGVSTGGIQGDGSVSVDVKLDGPFKYLTYSGSGLLENATLQLPSLTRPLAVKTATLRFEENSAVLENMVCTLAGSTLRAMVKVRNFAAPELQFSADVDQINVDELRKIAKDQPAAAAGAKSTGAVRGKGTLSVGKVQYGGVVLNKVKSECSLDRGVLKLDPVTAELFGGSQRGAITMDMRPEATAYAVQTKLERVDTNQLLSSTTSLKQLVYGLMAAEADLKFAPRPGEDIARSLNGTIGLRLNDGRLTGVNILNELSRIGQFLGYAPKGGAITNILLLTGTMQIRDGLASTDDLKLAFDGGSLGASGSLGLADQSIKMKVLSVLSKQASDRFGGSRVGGYLTTALANSKGELVIPCLVSGSMAKPMFVPDGAEFARLKVQSLLPSASNPLGAASGIIGAIEGGKKEGAKGVGGALLDMLGGGRKKEQKKQ
ncbi:MAG: AsmA family protein [Bryobacterales bacterium]|nr:AsmA family protein [Bryobacterales bacterium]